MTFEKFHNRVIIDAHLIAITPIFVGARTDSFKPGTINGSCVKNVYGRPYIPGSSLKGSLRALLSAVKDEPIKSKADEKFGKKEDRTKEVCEAKADDPKKYKDKSDDEILAELIVTDSTIVERLFGSKVMAGKVKVADAMPIDDNFSTEIRNGVAIDRDTRTAIDGALFDTEAVPSGTSFRFIASAENLTSDEAKLFGELMEYFANGNLTIGGRSRAGLGNVELRNVYVKVYRAISGSFPAEEKEKCCDKNQIKEAIKNVCEPNQ